MSNFRASYPNFETRFLSGYGTGTIIKQSLVASSYTNFFQSLPSLTQNLIKKFESLMHNFIRNRKPAKFSLIVQMIG